VFWRLTVYVRRISARDMAYSKWWNSLIGSLDAAYLSKYSLQTWIEPTEKTSVLVPEIDPISAKYGLKNWQDRLWISCIGDRNAAYVCLFEAQNMTWHYFCSTYSTQFRCK